MYYEEYDRPDEYDRYDGYGGFDRYDGYDGYDGYDRYDRLRPYTSYGPPPKKSNNFIIGVVVLVIILAVVLPIAMVLIYNSQSDNGGSNGINGYDVEVVTSPKVATSNPNERTNYWAIEITSVSGDTFDLDDARFQMSNKHDIRQWTKSIDTTGTTEIISGASRIYAIPSGAVAPDDGAGGTIDASTSVDNYYNCSVAYIDNDMDREVSTGDSIFIYKDHDRDGTADVDSDFAFELLYKDEMVVKKTL